MAGVNSLVSAGLFLGNPSVLLGRPLQILDVRSFYLLDTQRANAQAARRYLEVCMVVPTSMNTMRTHLGCIGLPAWRAFPALGIKLLQGDHCHAAMH
jgi:hypothetical protein